MQLPAPSTRSLCIAFLLILLVASSLSAQTQQDRDRQREQQDRESMALTGLEESGLSDTGEEPLQDFEFDYGGILRSSYYHLHDNAETRVFRLFDLKLWTSLVYRNTHQIYLRPQATITDYNEGDEYLYRTGVAQMEENDLNWPRLDVGYYYGDLTRAFRIEEIGSWRVKAGRQYITVGEGLVLDSRGDGVQTEYKTGDLTINGFVVRSVYSDDRFDRTHPDQGHLKYLFSGLQLEYEFGEDLSLFGFGVLMRDKGRGQYETDPDYSTVKYGYDSQYYGGGLRGKIKPGFSYFGEWALQVGDRYSGSSATTTPSFTRDDIRAQALHSGVDYAFTTLPMKPRLNARYVFATGDHDAGITTDTVDGNLAGTDDGTFFSYGYVDTGLAFFPLVSNLEMWSVGIDATPFSDHRVLGDLDVGIRYYDYKRNKSSGGISGRGVDRNGTQLGHEWDFTLTWRPYSDVMALAEYGLFKPDLDSYSDNGYRPFVALGLLFFF